MRIGEPGADYQPTSGTKRTPSFEKEGGLVRHVLGAFNGIGPVKRAVRQ